MADSNKLVSLNSILSYIRTHLTSIEGKTDKISISANTVSIVLGDSTTTNAAIWGNSTNKVAISATNSSSGDGHRYAIRAQSDGIQLYDYSSGTSGSAVYKIYPTSGTSPISVSNGVVSIQAASDSQNGYLSSTLYTKLNSNVAVLGNKASSGSGIYSNASSADGSTGYVAGLSLIDTYGNTYLLASTASLLSLRTKVSGASEYTTTWSFNPNDVVTSASAPLSISSHNITISAATASAAGSMSAADKATMDRITVASGAELKIAQSNHFSAQATTLFDGSDPFPSSSIWYSTGSGGGPAIATYIASGLEGHRFYMGSTYMSHTKYTRTATTDSWTSSSARYEPVQMMQIYRTSASASLAAGSPVRLSSMGVGVYCGPFDSSTSTINDGNGNAILSLSSNGIKVHKAGVYRVTGGLGLTVEAGVTSTGVYIETGTSHNDSTTLCSYYTSNTIDTYMQVGPKLVELAANTTIYLYGRTVGAKSTILGNADSNPKICPTWLQVEFVYSK